MKDNVRIKLLLKKANDFLQLTLKLVVIVFKSFGGIVGVINFDLEDVGTITNPECVDDAEFVAYTVDKVVLGLTLSVIQGFIIAVSECRVLSPLALGPMCSLVGFVAITVIVTRDIGKIATKDLIFFAECILRSLVLSGNLRNAIT